MGNRIKSPDRGHGKVKGHRGIPGKKQQAGRGKVSTTIRGEKQRQPARLATVSQRENEGRLTSFFKLFDEELASHRASEPAKAFAIARQRERMRKRACFVRPHLEAEAFEQFQATNAQAGFIELHCDELIAEAQAFIEHVLMRYTRKIYEGALPDDVLPPSWLEDNWRFGPKASNGVKGWGTVKKIQQAMTHTSSAEPLIRRLRMSCLSLHLKDLVSDSDGLKLVRGSRLTTVPKNENVVRTIATEPSGNMAAQLALARVIEEALAAIGLNIRTQEPKNQLLAKLGSTLGSLCTIDLKSASDLISRQLIAATWPASYVELFNKLRSPVTDIRGKEVHLNMLSTMGNGFTFPVMTLTLLAIIYAYRRLNGGPRLWVDWSITGIFGDDIIVRSEEFVGVCEALEACGLVVNRDKSYAEGHFRESCGGDYYDGQDVTPVYVESLQNVPEIYVAINKVLDWSSHHQVATIRSLRYLRSLLKKVYLVPEWAQPNSGVRTSLCPRDYKYLATIPSREEYRGDPVFLGALASGGYLESGGEDGRIVFSVHPDIVEYETREARLPSGYRDGWDPLCGDLMASTFRSLYVDLVV